MRSTSILQSFPLTMLTLSFLLWTGISLTTAQDITVFPQADTLSLWGTCTPPGFICRLDTTPDGFDRIIVHPHSGDLIRGTPFGTVTAHFDSAYFEIQDPLHVYHYLVFFTAVSPFNSGRFFVPFDSLVYASMGQCKITLLVYRDIAHRDSAILKFDSYQTGLGVKEDPSNLPHRSALLQNYPNPFNPSTVVSYIVPQSGRVRLEVFDLLGHPIDVLADKFQTAGYYLIHWKPKAFSSGVYFLSFSSGQTTSLIKCQFLK
jgi:hypothetical protein